MSKYPLDYDTNVELPPVNNNITTIGQSAINALRDAVFKIEHELGLTSRGSMLNASDRLDVSLNPDGTIKPSALMGLGLVTLPIMDYHVSTSAAIQESKLALDHKTTDLYNDFLSLQSSLSIIDNWIAFTGGKIDPHINGISYRHNLDHIDVSSNPSDYLKNKFNVLRNNANAYKLIVDINNELLAHHRADGSAAVTGDVTTDGGLLFPSSYAHIAGGIYLDSRYFTIIPQNIKDLQTLINFIDASGSFLFDVRIQNLFTNGISVSSSSSVLDLDGYGQSIIPVTKAKTYLRYDGTLPNPFDSIDSGDDIIELLPDSGSLTSKTFDSKFALIKVGDIIRVNYGLYEAQHIIKEVKYLQTTPANRFFVRINGKNIEYNAEASVRIDKPLFYNNKYGVLSVAAANNEYNEHPSLIVGNPRSAMVLGTGFNPDDLDASHYLLYLVIYPTGNPADGSKILPGIDVTGNKGLTPGKYTLESVVKAFNEAVRAKGYNYRFIAFSHQGEFGIMLSDSYNNASFSIINGNVKDTGDFDETTSPTDYPNNVIEVIKPTPSIPASDYRLKDALGFGPNKGNVSSPPLLTTYSTNAKALKPTKLFVPLKRNNFYVGGFDRNRLSNDFGQSIDGYGDGYWHATIKDVVPGSSVAVTYTANLDLSPAKLKPGKTIVVQQEKDGTIVDFGRFIIKSVAFSSECLPSTTPGTTDITVWDAVHSTGSSPYIVSPVGTKVRLYFGSDSVSFNEENSTDESIVSGLFKRFFEVYVTKNTDTFTHERVRFSATGSNIILSVAGAPVTLRTTTNLSKLDLISTSFKLKGQAVGSIDLISLKMISYDSVNGFYEGYLQYYDGTKAGILTRGKLGEVTRFYDQTGIDYIDIKFDIDSGITSFTNEIIDFQLFPTLSLDEEIMLIGTCELNDATKKIINVKDERQFGNTSEKDLSTSLKDTLSLPEKYLHVNGIIRGFDLESDIGVDNPNSPQIYLKGGVALVNGKFLNINNQMIIVPPIQEYYGTPLTTYPISWALCANAKAELEFIPLLDYDKALTNPTVNDDNRLFYAINMNSPYNQYYMDAVKFDDLVARRKDLCPLYIVKSYIYLTGTPQVDLNYTITLSDARRYVNDLESMLPLKYTNKDIFGNYRSIKSTFNWLMLNKQYANYVNLDGLTESAGTTDQILEFNFDDLVIIDGQNNATVKFTNSFKLGSNIKFKNIKLIFNKAKLSAFSDIKNIYFENCQIIINTESSVPIDNIIFDINNGSNINFKDCDITVTYTAQADSGNVFKFTNSSNINFDNTNISVIFNCDSVGYPGNIISFISGSNFKLDGGNISGNFNKAINLKDSDNIFIENCIITSSYVPIDGINSYNEADLVNTGSGYIYSYVTREVCGLFINNIEFRHIETSGTKNRYSFINIELYSSSLDDVIIPADCVPTDPSLLALARINNIKITNCEFNSSTLTVSDDLRAAISIINKNASGGSDKKYQPYISEVVIANNISNKNHLILITSETAENAPLNMKYPGLVSYNCVIENNTCGAIGYWIANANKFINQPISHQGYPDKESSLMIRNNTCKYIANMYSNGTYFLTMRDFYTDYPYTNNMCEYPSGYVDIKNNKTSWIHVGVSAENSAAINITENILTAYDVQYLYNYKDQLSSVSGYNTYVANSFDYAIFVNSYYKTMVLPFSIGFTKFIGVDTKVNISRNTVDYGRFVDKSTSSIVNYGYGSGYIFCLASNIISDNNLKGLQPNESSLPRLIVVGGLNNNITGNIIQRNNNDIYSYISFDNFNLKQLVPIGPWGGEGSSGIITDNMFDSHLRIDSDLTSEDLIFLTPLFTSSTAIIRHWVVTRNINQTSYVSVPITNEEMSGYNQYGFKQGLPFSSSYYITNATASTAKKQGWYRSNSLLIIDKAGGPISDTNGDLLYSSDVDGTLGTFASPSLKRDPLNANFVDPSYTGKTITIAGSSILTNNGDYTVTGVMGIYLVIKKNSNFELTTNLSPTVTFQFCNFPGDISPITIPPGDVSDGYIINLGGGLGKFYSAGNYAALDYAYNFSYCIKVQSDPLNNGVYRIISKNTDNSVNVQSIIASESNLNFAIDNSVVDYRELGWQQSLHKYVPQGARIVGIKLGVNTMGSKVVPDISYIGMYLNKYSDPLTYANDISSITPPDFIDNNISSIGYDELSGPAINAASATNGYMVYVKIDVAQPDLYVLGYGNQEESIGISLHLLWKRFASTDDVNLALSPIMVKYRW